MEKIIEQIINQHCKNHAQIDNGFCKTASVEIVAQIKHAMNDSVQLYDSAANIYTTKLLLMQEGGRATMLSSIDEAKLLFELSLERVLNDASAQH